MSESSFMIHGYDFGDTILEDVYFKVEVNLDTLEVQSVTVEPSSESYFKTLNTKMWLKAAMDSADDTLKDLKARFTPEQVVEVLADKAPNGTLEI